MKTRIRFLDDGAREVIRLFSPYDLERVDTDDPLMFEKSIVWLDDVESLPFVRVKVVRTACSRRGQITFDNGARVVGYAKLTPNARRCPTSNGYVRRVFYLQADDPIDPDAAVPDHTYDPKTIFPGAKGRQFHASQC